MLRSRSSETLGCGFDCQRRVSCDANPGSPTTFTANPRFLLGITRAIAA